MSKTNTIAEDVLRDFIRDIESTGGVISLNDGNTMPMGDPEWLDIGDTYLNACEALGHKPMIEYSDVPLTEYRDEDL